jgi:hypothetical protein
MDENTRNAMSRGVLYEERQRTVDSATGELKDERVHTLVKKTTPEFIMLFQQTSEPLRNANLTTAQSSLLFEILVGGYILRDNRVDLTPGARDEMEINTKLSRNTINKAIGVFVEKKLILREPGKRSGHLLNPFIFGKGRFTDLEKLRIEVATEFDFDKLESTRTEKTASTYKQSQELLESPHRVVSDETNHHNEAEHRIITVEEDTGYRENANPKQQLLKFEEAQTVEAFPNDKQIDLEMLREKNRSAELENKAMELRIEDTRLQIELIKIQRS